MDRSVQWAQSLGIPLPSLKFHLCLHVKIPDKETHLQKRDKKRAGLPYGMPGLWPEQSQKYFRLNIFSVSCYWQRQKADMAGDMLGFNKVKATYF